MRGKKNSEEACLVRRQKRGSTRTRALARRFSSLGLIAAGRAVRGNRARPSALSSRFALLAFDALGSSCKRDGDGKTLRAAPSSAVVRWAGDVRPSSVGLDTRVPKTDGCPLSLDFIRLPVCGRQERAMAWPGPVRLYYLATYCR